MRAGIVVPDIDGRQASASVSDAFSGWQTNLLAQTLLQFISSHTQSFRDAVCLKIDLFCACLHMNAISGRCLADPSANLSHLPFIDLIQLNARRILPRIFIEIHKGDDICIHIALKLFAERGKCPFMISGLISRRDQDRIIANDDPLSADLLGQFLHCLNDSALIRYARLDIPMISGKRDMEQIRKTDLIQPIQHRYRVFGAEQDAVDIIAVQDDPGDLMFIIWIAHIDEPLVHPVEKPFAVKRWYITSAADKQDHVLTSFLLV